MENIAHFLSLNLPRKIFIYVLEFKISRDQSFTATKSKETRNEITFLGTWKERKDYLLY